MSKIIVDKIELKNFFSYGNNWQSIDLREGVNIVLGHDKDKDRSNGAGKTSFLEAIPFALFGQTSKGVALPKIINWKNGKQCEVKLHFHKDGIPYMIHRGVKPGILTLTKDGVDVPKLSDKRVFQMELENDLIGMDFKAAQAILFQNANNMVSIFNTPKAEKRRFIEKFFNLEAYSKINEQNNSKLQNIIKRLTEINMELDFKVRRVDEISNIIDNTAIPNIKEYERSLLGFKKRLDDFLRVNVINDTRGKEIEIEIETQHTKRNQLNEEQRETLSELGRMDDKTNLLNGEKLTLEKRIETIGDTTEQRDKLNKIKAVLDTMGDLEDMLKENQVLVDGVRGRHSEIMVLYASATTEKKQITKEVDKWTNYENTDDTTCPTCFQDVDVEHIRSHVMSLISECHVKLSVVNSILKDFELQITEHKEKRELLDGEIKLLADKLDKKRQLERHLVGLSGVEEKEQEIITTNERINEIVNELLPVIDEKRKSINLRLDVITVDKEIVEGIIIEKQSEQLDYTELVQKKTTLKQDIDTEQRIYDNQKEIYDRVMIEHEAHIVTKTQLELEVSDFDGETKKLETMKDYLEYIKMTLKDENVKQYAIGNIIPYLQQQTNHYLGETGNNYYIELDAWLDGTIKGYGVGECEFGNMSGGEGKSIDLALKFAMLDVARRQAGSYLDILVLDELLDSSIDSFGIEKMMDIVKLKQQEDNLKVFIVSHREEVVEFGSDSVYRVEKEDGFSTIKVE